MSDNEHKKIVKMEQEGKIFIGICRAKARKFYTDVSGKRIEQETGEYPYLEKLLIWGAFLGSPIALLASIFLGFSSFGWWGVISMAAIISLYVTWLSSSSRGDSKIIGISIAFVASLFIHVFSSEAYSKTTILIVIFLLALWLLRFLYCSSTFFLRCFVIRNARAFKWLKEDIRIRDAGLGGLERR